MKNNREQKPFAFSESRKGYSKEDVNRYIEEMNIRFSRVEDSMKDEIARLKKQCSQIEEEKTVKSDTEVSATADAAFLNGADSGEKIKELTKLLNEKEEAIKELNEKALMQDAVIKELSEEMAQKEKEIASLKASSSEKEAVRSYAAAASSTPDRIKTEALVISRLMTETVKNSLASTSDEIFGKLGEVTDTTLAQSEKLILDLMVKLKAVGYDLNDESAALRNDVCQLLEVENTAN